MALGNIGAFKGKVESNTNLINTFKTYIKTKYPNWASEIHQMSIEAPEGTTVIINDVNITMPSSGMLQFGFDVINFDSLIFTDSVDVNIVYIY